MCWATKPLLFFFSFSFEFNAYTGNKPETKKPLNYVCIVCLIPTRCKHCALKKGNLIETCEAVLLIRMSYFA